MPAAAGDPVAAGAGGLDAFPAMTAARRPVRRLRPAREPVPRLGEAVDAFLAQPDLAASSRRSYAQTLGRLRDAVGADWPLERLGARELERVAGEAWGPLAPATWNRHVATLRSFSAFCRRRGWVDAAIADGLQRRREPVDRTKAVPYAQLDRLWRRDDVAVREKALWRLLYETAARAQEVLSLNVEDVDLDNKRARVRSTGGDIEWLHLQAGSARLLPRLIAGRARGPLFLADRRPAPPPASAVPRCRRDPRCPRLAGLGDRREQLPHALVRFGPGLLPHVGRRNGGSGAGADDGDRVGRQVGPGRGLIPRVRRRPQSGRAGVAAPGRLSGVGELCDTATARATRVQAPGARSRAKGGRVELRPRLPSVSGVGRILRSSARSRARRRGSAGNRRRGRRIASTAPA
jgi:integrase